MEKLPEEVLDILKGKDTIRVLTTTDEDGVPHSVFKDSLTDLDEEKIAYMELLEISNTNKNMLRSYWDKKTVVVSLLNSAKKISYQIKGEPDRFLIEGPIWDKFLDVTWGILPNSNPAGVWVIKPHKIINQTYENRLAQEIKRRPNFALWFNWIGKRLK
ncbi:MAG: hypothetical protein SV062_07805 [Thermodesulfobacteriota bacterium]|nr:hypothetical protein [Thermodesulfobacteriota bacterium]